MFVKLSFSFVIQAVKTLDPFYIIAHMVNSREALDWAVSQGANAIEIDLQFNNNGDPTVVEHGHLCDCLCAILSGHICNEGLNRKCGGIGARNDAAAHMQYVARQNSIALFYIDSKLKSEWGNYLGKAGAAVIPFIDNNLFNYGYKGKVIIDAGEIDRYDYIQSAVIATLSHLTNNRIYATGISACLPKAYDSALEAGVAGKIIGENSMTFVWTIDRQSSLREYINLGIQRIITNRIAVAREIVNSMDLTMANTSTAIPISTVNVPFPNKCECKYNNDGCKISLRAPSRKACKFRYKGFWTCDGFLLSCDVAHPTCVNPDESKEACQLGQGNCNGY